MKFTMVIFSSMIVILLALTQSVSLRPTAETPTADEITVSKRSSIAYVRRSIHELEQIEEYYQQLLVRGYLLETDYRRLELLQQFIEQLKGYLQTMLNAEQDVSTS